MVIHKKAHLVAQGFLQPPGVDYFDTFAPVACLSSICTVLALATYYDMELHQIDIKGVYLNGELTSNETIYMHQPPSFISATQPKHVCCLVKTLYRLKQSGQCWYQKLVKILVGKLGFSCCNVDQAVFFKWAGDGQLTMIMVHIDDCTIAATNLALIEHLKHGIKRFVEITDLGELHWLLGIEIRQNREACTISLSQHAYIKLIIHWFRFEDLKPISTPMDPSAKLSVMQSPLTRSQYTAMMHIPYCEAIGALMYTMLSTWPDILYAITMVSKYSGNPGTLYWKAVKQVYWYLTGTMDMWLSLGREMKGYADADGSMGEDQHTLSGYTYLIDGGAVSWSMKRQEIISLSTTESKYIATTHATKEGLWLWLLITQLFSPLSGPTTLFLDNQSAIALAKDHQYHAQTKHIDVCFHFIQWIIEDGKLHLIYCPTANMVTDVFTKALPSPKVKHFTSELGLCNTWGGVLEEQVLQSHLLVLSLLSHMSYRFNIATHYYIAFFDPLLSPRLPAVFISFVLIILAQLRLRYYVSQYLTTIELHTHLRDCHSLYNSEVCFRSQCITPVLTNPVDVINYRSRHSVSFYDLNPWVKTSAGRLCYLYSGHRVQGLILENGASTFAHQGRPRTPVSQQQVNKSSDVYRDPSRCFQGPQRMLLTWGNWIGCAGNTGDNEPYLPRKKSNFL